MKCPHCKNEVNAGGAFCPVCGKELNVEVVQQPEQQTHKKCFYVFAKVGFWLAVAAFIVSFIPYLNSWFGLGLAVPAIVFIGLGKRTKPAKSGLGFAIAAIVLSIVISIVVSIVPYLVSFINAIIYSSAM